MEQDLESLFNEIDEDQSGFIDKFELKKLFNKLGINISDQELAGYFEQIDTDKSGLISLEEFKQMMTGYIKREMITAEDIIDDIRKEFKKVDFENHGSINADQLRYDRALPARPRPSSRLPAPFFPLARSSTCSFPE